MYNNIFNNLAFGFLWSILGIFSGIITYIFVNNISNIIFMANITKNSKYCIILFITFSGFLRGYTGNDFVTNIKLLL